MQRLHVELNKVAQAPKEPRAQDKPTDEEVWDAVADTMAENPHNEYLHHILGFEWVPAAPERLLAVSEKPNYTTGVMTWYLKIYVK